MSGSSCLNMSTHDGRSARRGRSPRDTVELGRILKSSSFSTDAEFAELELGHAATLLAADHRDPDAVVLEHDARSSGVAGLVAIAVTGHEHGHSPRVPVPGFASAARPTRSLRRERALRV